MKNPDGQILEERSSSGLAEDAQRIIDKAKNLPGGPVDPKLLIRREKAQGRDEDLEALLTEIKRLTEESEEKHELNSEQAWLGKFKNRFTSMPELHKSIGWADVQKSLEKNPEAMSKLQALDGKGHEMNVFGEENGKIIFRTAQTDVTKIAAEHRTIMYDKKAQTDYSQYNVNGNAEDIAASMGVELADPELYEQLRVKSGWVWLKTDAATRASDFAFFGYIYGVGKRDAFNRNGLGSFCAALRVNKD